MFSILENNNLEIFVNSKENHEIEKSFINLKTSILNFRTLIILNNIHKLKICPWIKKIKREEEHKGRKEKKPAKNKKQEHTEKIG